MPGPARVALRGSPQPPGGDWAARSKGSGVGRLRSEPQVGPSGCVTLIWAQADSVSPSCIPSSDGLSDSPALGFSSALLLMLLLLCSSLE